MGPDLTIDVFRQGLYVAMMMIAVLVLPGLLVGLMVAMFQAATQINEMSLSFIPKIMITFIVLSYAGPWLLQLITQFTRQLIMNIPEMLG